MKMSEIKKKKTRRRKQRKQEWRADIICDLCSNITQIVTILLRCPEMLIILLCFD